VCVVYDLHSGVELKRRRFNYPNKDYYFYVKSIVINDGKFVILCENNLHIVDATSLETIGQIPCGDVRYIYMIRKCFWRARKWWFNHRNLGSPTQTILELTTARYVNLLYVINRLRRQTINMIKVYFRPV